MARTGIPASAPMEHLGPSIQRPIRRCSPSGIECVANPVDRGAQGRPVDGYHVEPARPIIADSVHHEVVLRCRDETCSLGGTHAFHSPAECPARSPPHLDEYQSAGVTHHEIDLATPAPVVPRDGHKAVPGEKFLGLRFGIVPDRVGSIGPAMASMAQRSCLPVPGAREFRRQIAPT